MRHLPIPLLLRFGALAVLALVAVACAPPPPEEPLELETVDVELPIDAEFSTDDDVKAVKRAAATISGLVPGDVPRDLPLFSPSSVVDFGAAAGRSYVELDASAPPAAVRAWLGERLPAAGWGIVAIGDDLVRADRAGRTVEYRLTDLAPGTRIRLVYEPQS